MVSVTWLCSGLKASFIIIIIKIIIIIIYYYYYYYYYYYLTLLTIKSSLPNRSTMVSVTWLCSGLKASFIAAHNLSNSIKLALQCKPSSVVSLKVQF